MEKIKKGEIEKTALQKEKFIIHVLHCSLEFIEPLLIKMTPNDLKHVFFKDLSVKINNKMILAG